MVIHLEFVIIFKESQTATARTVGTPWSNTPLGLVTLPFRFFFLLVSAAKSRRLTSDTEVMHHVLLVHTWLTDQIRGDVTLSVRSCKTAVLFLSSFCMHGHAVLNHLLELALVLYWGRRGRDMLRSASFKLMRLWQINYFSSSSRALNIFCQVFNGLALQIRRVTLNLLFSPRHRKIFRNIGSVRQTGRHLKTSAAFSSTEPVSHI